MQPFWQRPSSALATPRSRRRWRSGGPGRPRRWPGRRRTTHPPLGRPSLTWPTAVIPPGSTIGILGGGQLGRMTAMAAARLGYRALSLCPEARRDRGPGRAAHMQGAYDDTPPSPASPPRSTSSPTNSRTCPRPLSRPARSTSRYGRRPAHPLRPASAAREGVLSPGRSRHGRLPGDPQPGRCRWRDRAPRHPQDLHRGL